MKHSGLNGDLPRIVHEPAAPPAAMPAGLGDRARSPGGEGPMPKDVPALRAALATTHARYGRAMHEAQRATEPASRRAAFAEARRLAARASRLQARLRDE